MFDILTLGSRRREKRNNQKCQNESNDSFINFDLKKRIIYIRGEVDSLIARDFAMGFNDLKGQKKTIMVDIGSPGGEVASSLDIFNKLRNSGCPIIMVTFGVIASGALLIFLGGDERIISKNAIIRFHWPVVIRENEEINPDSTEADRDYFKKIFEHAGTIIAGRTGLSLREVKNYMRYAKAFDGVQSREIGLATKILEEDGVSYLVKRGYR